MVNFFPKARSSNVLTTKVADETVVYDAETNQASCLNGLTTVVWEACDGNTDIESILEAVRNAGYQDATDQLIMMALDQLEQADLVEMFPDMDVKSRKSLNRREMLRLIGIRASIVLPLVSTINIRPAIAQVSCGNKFDPCSTSSDCCYPFHCTGAGFCSG